METRVLTSVLIIKSQLARVVLSVDAFLHIVSELCITAETVQG